MIGFCPDGPLCKLGHPKYELPRLSGDDPNSQSRLRTRTPVVCHKCGVAGHKAANCPDAPRVRFPSSSYVDPSPPHL
jgi:hypothetical protein